MVANAFESKFQAALREGIYTERQHAFTAVEGVFQQIYDNYIKIETDRRMAGLVLPYATKHTTETLQNAFI